MLDSLFILVQMIFLAVLLTWAVREDSKDEGSRKDRRSR